MSKKQIAKLLLALGIGVATAASGAAFVGCGNSEDNGDDTNMTQPGDDTDGGNTDGGNTDGGNTDGGNTDGGNTDGGNTDGGNTDGGNTDGGNTDATEHSFVFDYEDFQLDVEADDNADLIQDNFVGAYSWINVVTDVVAGSPITKAPQAKFRASSNHAIEIRHAALSFEVQGTATFSIAIGSTGSGDTNISAFALMKADGTYVTGADITNNSDDRGHVVESEVSGIYYVYKTKSTAYTAKQLTYSNLEEGTYYLVNIYSDPDDAPILVENTKRNTRIYSMSLVDLY